MTEDSLPSAAIYAMAASLQRDIGAEATLYREIFGELQANSRIRDFVPVLVEKKVRQIVKRRR